MAKITYENKEFLNENAQISNINKVTDADLNEIKNVVNGIDDAVEEISTKLTAVILYSSDEYSESITLSDSAANYSYFLVRLTADEYTPSQIKEETMVLVNPDGKEFSHSICWYNSSNDQMYGGHIILNISGTSLTIISNTTGTVGADTAYFSTDKTFKIVEVLGYK